MKGKIFIFLVLLFLIVSGISEVVATKQHSRRNVSDSRIVNRESEQSSEKKKIRVTQKVTEQSSETKEYISLNSETVQDIVTTDTDGERSVTNQSEIQDTVENLIESNSSTTEGQTGKDESTVLKATSEEKQDTTKAGKTEVIATTERETKEKDTEKKNLETKADETKTEETTTDLEPVSEETEEWFRGVLIDQDCSDFENPPEHDLPCMLMYSCRDSGYGINVEEGDSWKFYPFDENGNNLSWAYLNKTTRLYGLWVDVKGELKNGKIYVSELKEG